VFVTGDGNTVEVKLTVVVADAHLQASAASTRENPYRGSTRFARPTARCSSAARTWSGGCGPGFMRCDEARRRASFPSMRTASTVERAASR
jgi:hypothetical protein